MKLLIGMLLLAASQLCSALQMEWSAPTSRENGQYLAPHELCCYEIRGRNAQGKFVWTAKVNNTSNASKYTYTFSLPKELGVVSYEIAAIDTNGLYSRFVNVTAREARKLLAPTNGSVD